MNREEMAERYFAAWNQRDLSALLKLLHSQASYYDAFWQESCSGQHLPKFLEASLHEETRWYRPIGELIPVPNGMICRYAAFAAHDPAGLETQFTGAEVFTLSDGLIMTVSDYYCNPGTEDLVEIATLAEGQHGRASTIERGLGAKTSSRIKRRLAETATHLSVILDPSLTVTKLADHVGCSVMHLFNVLEEQKRTTFLEYVAESRARYASTLMVEAGDGDIRLDRIAERSCFETLEELDEAFEATFGIDAGAYLEKFAK